MDDEKIIQIVEAPNWYAVYWEEAPPYYSKFPLACWALMADSLIVGMDTTGRYLEKCTEATNFGGYTFGPSETPEQKADFEAKSKAWHEAHNKK